MNYIIHKLKEGEIGMEQYYCIYDPAGHSLAEVNESEEFQCDGCKIPGNGPRYRCHKCDFNFHECCRNCPSTLSTFMHPQHHLELVTGAEAKRNNQGFCDLCDDNVEGLFYRCKICDFDIHPLCTKLPEYVPHVLHPDHKLKLHNHKSSPGPGPDWCRVCETECTSWRYGCRTCSFDIHLECILLARCCDASTSETASRSAQYGPTHYVAYGPTHYWPTHYGPTHYGLQYPYQYSSTPPPYYYQSAAPAPTHFGAYYVHPDAYAPPSPSYGAAPPPPPPPTYGFASPPPPSYGVHAHGEHPAGFIPHGVNHSLTVGEAQGSGKPPKWGKRLGKIMFCLVTNLTVGLLCGAVFGI